MTHQMKQWLCGLMEATPRSAHLCRCCYCPAHGEGSTCCLGLKKWKAWTAAACPASRGAKVMRQTHSKLIRCMARTATVFPTTEGQGSEPVYSKRKVRLQSEIRVLRRKCTAGWNPSLFAVQPVFYSLQDLRPGPGACSRWLVEAASYLLCSLLPTVACNAIRKTGF